MSTQHTPGPWGARQTFSNRWDIEVLREGLVPLTIGHVSTAVLGVGTYRADLTKANAQLIAAAPDMLEFLQALNRIGGLGLNVHRQLDALIAKVTGESA
jgi:hypothetical protein